MSGAEGQSTPRLPLDSPLDCGSIYSVFWYVEVVESSIYSVDNTCRRHRDPLVAATIVAVAVAYPRVGKWRSYHQLLIRSLTLVLSRGVTTGNVLQLQPNRMT